MEMVSVQSSQISAIGYDPETMEARVEFSNGSVYSYSQVPMGVTDSIIHSESPGRTFAQVLKFGYQYSRVS